jgi:radical SAM superfamily enzyme YgiQ (UPF0313 family)
VRVVLISNYDQGHQPFGLASPAAWLRRAGHDVNCVDLSVDPLPSLLVREAELVAIYVPMHTATRMAAETIRRVRALNPNARLCCYGLYAPMNADFLRSLGAEAILGGEFEPQLLALAAGLPTQTVALDRISFAVPDRNGLPTLERYPKLVNEGVRRRAGYTEASRGCKHLCRHCPVVPVYNGVFRIVQPEVVLEDIRRQVAAGAEHITFGDPDFLNGPAHARRIVEALHAEFPDITYDVTIKIEHLLRHTDLLPVLRSTGCLFVTSAVESIDDTVLERLDKGHTRADFIEVTHRFRELGLTLAATFIPFTPWTTIAGYRDLLACLADMKLVDAVAPVQLMLRLLIPAGSRLLDLPDIRSVIEPFEQRSLVWPWRHEDPQVESLAAAISKIVRDGTRQRLARHEIFLKIWQAAYDGATPPDSHLLPRTVIPYLEEPWFC